MGEKRKIYLVRHGTPEGNLVNFCGITDYKLSELGKKEASASGKYFAALGFNGKFYSSPMSRSFDTGKIIAKEIESVNPNIKFDIKIKDLFIELNFGLVENISIEQFKKEHPAETMLWMSDFYNQPFPEGESFKDCGNRFCQGLAEVLAENKDNNDDIIITAHMCVIEGYLIGKGFLKADMNCLANPIHCASITTLTEDESGNLTCDGIGYFPKEYMVD